MIPCIRGGGLATLLGLGLASCAAAPVPGAQRSLADTVLIAKRLASARTAQPPGAIEVLAAEEVTWGDSSLGCPSPGRNYMQVLTPGYLIRLRAGEATLQMHADRRGSVLACPPERAERPAPDGAVR